MTTKAFRHGRDTRGYTNYLKESNKTVEAELSSLMPEIAELRLCERMRYVLHTHGKGLRATLAMLSAQSLGANRKIVRRLALAIELLHAATLVHDDILDQDKFRRNSLAIHAKWSIRDAILTGDALASLSLSLATSYGEEIMKIMADTGIVLCDGEYMDVEMTLPDMSEAEYMEKIRKKSASLFETAARCGALAADGSQTKVDSLARFGLHFGLGYQIRDDLSDVFIMRKSMPPDLSEFRATLPLIRLYESSSSSERERFIEAIKPQTAVHNSNAHVTLSEFSQRLKSSGSLDYCSDRIEDCIKSACKDIEPIKDSIHKTYLVQMAESLRPKQSES